MKNTEKVLSGAITIVLGMLLLILRANVISIVMTVAGIALLVLGFLDLMHEKPAQGVCKLIAGGAIILCGWLIVSVVLYLLAAALMVAGIILLYEEVKKENKECQLWKIICNYAFPVTVLIIGFCLFFNQGNTVNWVFIVSGILTIIEGGLLLLKAFSEDK